MSRKRITSKQQDKLKTSLEKLRNEFIFGEQDDRRDLAEEIPADSADAASVKERLGITYTEYSTRRKQIDAIDEALRRIEKEEFGLCVECEEPISWARLNVIPHARYCIRCQTEREAKERR